MASITPSTINAKYMHASLGLRYLFANLGSLQTRSRIREFTINERPVDIAERLLADAPRIVGLGAAYQAPGAARKRKPGVRL